jgi:hypothetical protein
VPNLIPQEQIEKKIYLLRGNKVMFDRDLAELYEVKTKRLNEQVKRNIKRFPEDFMFQLNKEELENWKSQFAISNSIKMGLRKRPYVFTENGVAMLSSVLNSDRAIQVNIQIMRAFTRIRELLNTHKDLAHKLDDLERKVQKHDMDIQMVFQVIKQLMEPPKSKMKKIGF